MQGKQLPKGVEPMIDQCWYCRKILLFSKPRAFPVHSRGKTKMSTEIICSECYEAAWDEKPKEKKPVLSDRLEHRNKEQ